MSGPVLGGFPTLQHRAENTLGSCGSREGNPSPYLGLVAEAGRARPSAGGGGSPQASLQGRIHDVSRTPGQLPRKGSVNSYVVRTAERGIGQRSPLATGAPDRAGIHGWTLGVKRSLVAAGLAGRAVSLVGRVFAARLFAKRMRFE